MALARDRISPASFQRQQANWYWAVPDDVLDAQLRKSLADEYDVPLLVVEQVSNILEEDESLEYAVSLLSRYLLTLQLNVPRLSEKRIKALLFPENDNENTQQSPEDLERIRLERLEELFVRLGFRPSGEKRD